MLSTIQLTGTLVLVLLVRAIYRLTFHPLSKFPGPRLAAITSLYAASYDLPFETSFCKQMPQLHDKYGPIIRTRPNELHIRDIDSFNQTYKPGTTFSKDPKFYGAHIINGSFFNVCDTKGAKVVKDMYQPYFSQAAIQRLEGPIQAKVGKFLDALQAAANSSKVVDLTLAFKCLTADIVMGYCYNEPFGALDAEDFRFALIQHLEGLFGTASYTWYFPSLFNILTRFLLMLPIHAVEATVEPLAATIKIRKFCESRIKAIQAEVRDPTKPRIFDEALSPNSKGREVFPNLDALSADAIVFFAAGTDTTSHTLVTGTWHLLRNPEMLQKLRQELKTCIPDKEAGISVNWMKLEKLSYLRAVIKESLRLSFGVPGRIPRVVPPTGALICGQSIPPGTVIAHSSYTYHMSDQYFQDPFSFIPDRWVGSNARDLENTLVSFSRGSRGCLGVNLAYAELFTTFAYLFRRFDMETYNTTLHDMDWHDCYTPATFGHLKVMVKKTLD